MSAIYTFWDYFRKHWERNAGLRIDHLLLNAPLAPCLLEAGVDRWVRGREHASDHAPAWVEARSGESLQGGACVREDIAPWPSTIEPVTVADS